MSNQKKKFKDNPKNSKKISGKTVIIIAGVFLTITTATSVAFACGAFGDLEPAGEYKIIYHLNEEEKLIGEKDYIIRISKSDFPYRLAKAEKAGYDFESWRDKYGNHYETSIPKWTNTRTKNIDLYPDFDLNQYTIQYVTDQYNEYPSNPLSYNVTDGEEVLIDGVTKKIIYVYTCRKYYDTIWTDQDGVTYSKGYIEPKKVCKDLVLTASQYIKKQYDLILDANGGDFSGQTTKTLTFTADTEIVDLPVPTREGFAFNGYALYNNYSSGEYHRYGITNFDPFLFEKQSKKLYATWKQTTFKISYDTGEYQNDYRNPTTYKQNTGIIRLYSPRPYYQATWIDSFLYTFVNLDTSCYRYNCNISLSISKYDKFIYKYHLNSDGGLINGINSELDVTTSIDEASTSLPTPTKEGYEFKGWYDENLNRVYTVYYTNFDPYDNKTITLTAHWN